MPHQFYLLVACCKNQATYSFCCSNVSAWRRKKKRYSSNKKRKTKQNDLSRHASVSNQSSSRYKNKLTELCHNASPSWAAWFHCLSVLLKLVHKEFCLQFSDPVCSLFRTVHYYCLRWGHMHFWWDRCFPFPSQTGCSRFSLSLFFFCWRFASFPTLKSNKQHLQLHVRGDKSCSEPVGLVLKPKIHLIRVDVKTSLSDGGEWAGTEMAAGRCRDEMGFLPQRMQSDAIPGNYKQGKRVQRYQESFLHLKLHLYQY